VSAAEPPTSADSASGAGARRGAVAFVAGATGYVGREVVRELATRGVRTVAHVRPDSPRLAEWRERFARVGAETDATHWTVDAMTAALARIAPTHVFALLGTTRARVRAAAQRGAVESYEAVDYGLTSVLIRAAAREPRPPRFVYLSSTGVSGAARNAYIAARWRAEEELRASGLPYVIARPSFITGPDREEPRPLERTASVLADALLAAAGALGARRVRDRYRSTSAAALARALVRLAFDPAANVVVESEGLRA
jgi:nucleoside-diphosphate-sugar epimerase